MTFFSTCKKILHFWASQVALVIKNAGASKKRGFDPWVGKILWWRKWAPTPIFLPGKSHGQRGLVDYSPWCHKESDTTERLTLLLSFYRWLKRQRIYLSAMRETWVWSLEKEMATHSSSLVWEIPWMEDPGRLQSMGSQTVRHDWVTSVYWTHYKAL